MVSANEYCSGEKGVDIEDRFEVLRDNGSILNDIHLQGPRCCSTERMLA